MWIVGGAAIIMVDIKSKKISVPFLNHGVQKPRIQRSIIYESPVALFLDSKQNLWFSVWDGLIYKYNTLTFQKDMYVVHLGDEESKTIARSVAYCFGEDDKGKIWIGCYEQGFFYYDEKKIIFNPFLSIIKYHIPSVMNKIFTMCFGTMKEICWLALIKA